MTTDYRVPSEPFCEGWTFTVKLTEDPSGKNNSYAIKNRVYKAFEKEQSVDLENLESDRSPLKAQIDECIENAFPGPDFRYYITEYHERKGSWEICFAVIALFYGGVCGYGSFRQGIDTAKNDMERVFGAVKGIRARVKCKFKERVVLSKDKIDPIINEKYFDEY